jgi:6-phosphogluconolactonase (cycloisomerase 2 family)
MKTGGMQASVALATMLLVAGCSKFWDVPTNCTVNCPATISSGVFYVLNSNAGQVAIAGYSIVKGTLTPLKGGPNVLTAAPLNIAIAPNNSFLYVSTKSGIYLYTIGAGGALAPVSTTPILADFAAISLQVDATNSWLVEASGSGYLYALPISPLTGSPTGTVLQTPLGGIAPRQMTISPDNTYVIVALGQGGTEVIPFTASNANPLPAVADIPIAVKGVGGAALSVAVDPANQLLYIGETLGLSGSSNTGVVRAFIYSSLGGTPTEVTGSPYASGGLTPVSILPAAAGAYVYVANATISNISTGTVVGFSKTTTGTSYSLLPLNNTVSAGNTPAALAEDSTGSVVLLVNSGGSPDLNVYTFDTTTLGKLNPALTSATGTDPVGALAIAAAP